jgi:deaminated glutathione amidase
MKKITVAAIQLNPQDNVARNVEHALALIRKAHAHGGELVVLPELFLYRGLCKNFEQIAEKFGGPLTSIFSYTARRLKMGIVLGSILEKTDTAHKYYNTTFVISPEGKALAAYRKIHLFNAQLQRKKINESAYLLPGKHVVTARVCGVRVGLAICFDLRFPTHFRNTIQHNDDTQLLCVPSDFTHVTGKAHWEILVHARAIETQRFIIAPNLCGVNQATGVRSFGHSMIVDPWGKTLAQAEQKEAVIIAE